MVHYWQHFMKSISGAKWVIGLVICGIILAVAASYSASNTTAISDSMTVVLPVAPIAPYLNDFIQSAHEGFLADNIALNIDSSNIASEMASMIEEIDHEKSAVSMIAKYAL